jgi:hypothetical protein
MLHCGRADSWHSISVIARFKVLTLYRALVFHINNICVLPINLLSTRLDILGPYELISLVAKTTGS